MSLTNQPNMDHAPEFFAIKGTTEGLTGHPVLLVRQMANEILRLRALPAGEVVAEEQEDQPRITAASISEATALFGVLEDTELKASPAPVAAEPSGNPLLWNVHCMYQQAERDMGWHGQWRDLLAAIEQHLQRVGYPNPAPANESPVDKQTP